MKTNNKNSAGNSKPIPNDFDLGTSFQNTICKLVKRWRSQLIVSGVIVLLATVSLLDHILDLPHLLVGEPPSAINWMQIAFDQGIIFLVGFVSIFMLSVIGSKRKQTEAALKRERDFSQSILGTANSMIVCLDGDAKIMVFNQECERVTGYRREEVIGNRWTELFLPPDQRHPQLKSFARWVRAHPRDRYEGPIVTKSGEIRTILWSNTAILDSDDEQIVAIAIGHDITERKRVEEALRKSEERYRTLYENAPIGIYRTTPDGRILMVNPTLIRMLRFSSFDELASRNLEEEGFEATYPRSEFKERIEREGEVIGLEAAWVRRDSSVIFVRENAKAVRGEDGEVLYYEGTVEDITERKRAEEALEKERHRLFSVLDVLPAYVYVQAADYSIPFVNHKFRELFGDPDDRPCYEVFHGRSEPCEDCLTLRVLKTKTSQSYEWTSKDGRVYMIFEDLFPTIDGPEMVVEVGIDITKRKKAEEEIKAQSHFLESLIEQSPLPTFVIDSGGICVMVNKAFLKAYGVPQKEMVLGRNALTEPANVRQGVVKYIKEALSGKIVETPEIEFISPYEDKMTVTKSRLFPIFDPTNSLTNVVVLHEDVTERKKAERELEKSRERYRDLFELAPDSIVALDKKGVITSCNAAATKLSGYSKDELIGKHFSKVGVFKIKDIAKYLKLFNSIIEGKLPEPTEVHAIRKDGTSYTGEAHVGLLKEDGKTVGIQVITRDITERKRAEEALEKERHRLFSVLDVLPAYIYVQAADYSIPFVNRKFRELFGNPGERPCYEVFHGRSEPCEGCLTLRVLKTKTSQSYEWTSKDGRVYMIFEDLFPTIDGPEMVVEVGIDITERKRAEEKIKQVAEEWETTFNSITDLVSIHDKDFRFVRTNRAFVDIFKLKPEELFGKTCYELIHGTKEPWPNCPHKQVLKTKKPVTVELFEPHLGIHLEVSVAPTFNEKGEVVSTVHIVKDITERKRTEREIRKLNQYLESIIDNANVWLVVLDEKAKVVIWNKAAEQISGFSREEVIGHRKIWEWLYPDEKYRNEITTKAAAIIEKGEVVEDFETTIRCKNGEIKTISWNSRNLIGADGKPMGSIALGRDITERKRAEQDLIRLSAAVKTSTDSIVVSNIEAKIIDVNEATLRMYGADDRRDLIGKNSFDLIAPEDQEKALAGIKEVLEKGHVRSREYHIMAKDGSRIPVEMSAALMKDADGNAIGFVGISRDITERRRAEEEMREMSEATMQFVDFPREKDMYDFICEKVKRLVGDGIVSVNAINVENDTLQIHTILGIGPAKTKVIDKLLGRKVNSLSISGILQEAKDTLITGRLTKVEGGLHTVLFHRFPEAVCHQIEKLLGIREIYSIGLRRKGKLLGNVSIITLNNTTLNKNVIETFVNQASIALERRGAEEALRRSEQEIRMIANSIPALISYVDTDGYYRSVNKRYEEWFGIPQTKIIGKHYRQVLGEATHELVKPRVDAALSGQRVSYEEVLPYRHGGTRWVNADYVPDADDHGKIRGFFALVTDITERKRAEEAVRESEEKYRNLVEDSIDGICIVQGTTIKFVNKALVELFGCESEDEIVGQKFTDFVLPEYQRLMEERGYAREKREDVVPRYEFKALRKDGTEFDAELSVRRITYKGSAARQGIIRDITERKRAEEKLKEAYDIINRSPAVAFLWKNDEGWPVELVSDNVKNLFGYTADEFTSGKVPYAKIVHPDDLDRVAGEVTHYSEERGRTKFAHQPYRIITKEGEIKYVDDRTYIRRDEKGRITHYQGIVEDITERKQMEEALEESEIKYRTLVETAQEGIGIVDPDENIVFTNQALADLLGYNKDELLGLNLSQISDKEEFAKFRKGTQKRYLGKSSRYETKLYTKTGEPKYFSISATPLYDDRGDLIATLGLLTDITDRKRAEETLRESERRFSTIFRSSPMAIAITRPKDGELIDVNEAWEELSGYGREEAIGHTTLELNSWVDPHTRERLVSGLLEKGTVSGFEFRMRRKSGDIAHLLLSAELIEIAGESSMLSMALDITERKRAEEILRESEQRLSAFMNSATDGILIFDSELNLVEANKSALKILGLNKTDVIGKNILDISPDVREKDRYDRYLKVMKSDESFSIDNLVLHPEFGEKHLTIKAFKVGEGLGIIGTDITEQKKMEAQLIQAEKLSAVGTLSYGIAHEFNNILAGILCNAEFGMGNDDPKEVEECFRIIMEGCDRAKSITNGLLAFSRQREARRERADVTEAVITVIGLIDRELEKHNIKVVQKFKPVPEIACDLGEFSGVFLNMITNARDAMRPNGGTLTIEIGKKNDNIEIVLTDTGSGIPDSIKSRIFEPFVTTKGALGQSEIPGTGLGLFLSYGIISRYNGEIKVKSEKGKGSEFTIKIPISKNQVTPALIEPEEEKQAVVPQNLNILLVDDEKPICDAIRKFLANKGHNVTTTLSGKKGFKIFKKGGFDLVLADITIPDMDGVELISKLKEIDQQVKFIVLTGHIAEDRLESAERAGADHILMKPFRNEELYQVVGKVLSF